MRRLLLALSCISASLPAQATRASIGLPGFGSQFPIEDVTILFTLNAPRGKSYAAVKAAFADLKIPLTVDDSTGGLVGNQRDIAQLNFAGYRMSRIFDCGEASNTGPRADSYRLTIVLLALVDSVDASHTKLQVGFVAGATPPTGSRADAVQCGSKGTLEAKLVEVASARLK
jgi:hypothetical protein